MAGEVQVSYQSQKTVYALIYSPASGAMVWNTSLSGFQTYLSQNYSGYPLSLSEQGTSAYYVGNFPSVIPPGDYNVVAKQQVATDPAESDPVVGQGDLQWGGSSLGPLSLSDLATSGQVSQFLPTKVARSTMVRNFSLYLKSSTDHVTPFTSGVVSGQIIRGSGTWGPLQSGLITEMGNGFYNLLALTSGDLDGETVSLLFTANGVSGGTSDPLPLSFVLQKSSG